MKKIVLLILLIAILPVRALAQAKKPTIMVVPDDTYMNAKGYMDTFDNQGETVKVPDYGKAMREDMDLAMGIAKIGELMAERGLPLKDLQAELGSLRQQSAEDAMLQSRTSGASVALSPYDQLMRRAKADIIIKLSWKVNKTGPQRSVSYIMKGIDAYTNKQVAAASGTGQPSIAAESSVLVEEAVLEKMDQFISQLQAHFDDLLANGREISLRVKVFDNGSGLSLEDEYNGDELGAQIESWVEANTQNHRFNTTDATDNYMLFEQVRIPLYNERGRATDARMFGTALQKHLKQPPFGLESKVVAKGLGLVEVILGEK